MSMLKNFFEIGADKTPFDGLTISKETALCEKYLGKFPVIFILLKDVDGLRFEDEIKAVCLSFCRLPGSREYEPVARKLLEMTKKIILLTLCTISVTIPLQIKKNSFSEFNALRKTAADNDKNIRQSSIVPHESMTQMQKITGRKDIGFS